ATILQSFLSSICSFPFPSSRLFRSYYALSNNLTELITLIKNLEHSIFWHDFRLDNHAYPAARLAQLFQADRKLMDKICAALRRTSLFIIRGWRSPAPYELACDMTAHSCVRKQIDYLSNSRGKADQSFNHLLWFH